MKSPDPRAPDMTRKQSYRDRYDAAKKGGESFFPDTIARDAVVGLIIVAGIFVLATVLPASTQPPADPASTTYNPRPEWYFLFFFQFLKLFPGYLEPVAAAVIPVLALLLFILVPFLDRDPERRLRRRKKMTGIGAAAVIFLAVLGVAGAMSAPAVPAGEESHQVQTGRQVYRQFNCAYCHSINGAGGAVGPDLSQTGGTWKREDLIAYLVNPNSMIPQTLHPKLLFTNDEVAALGVYLLTLGATVPYSAEAPGLFEQHCGACHAVNGKGGNLGPDLSHEGGRRSMSFVQAFTTDPKSVISGSTMPAFKKALSTSQIADLAAYLYSLK